MANALTKKYDRAEESVALDQTARKCRLILVYNLREKIHGREKEDKD